MSGSWGEPVHPPTRVSGSGALPYEVVTVNSDGTVDLRNTRSRATRTHVPGIAGWTPSPGDRVIALDLGGDRQAPAVITVQTSAIPFGS